MTTYCYYELGHEKPFEMSEEEVVKTHFPQYKKKCLESKKSPSRTGCIEDWIEERDAWAKSWILEEIEKYGDNPFNTSGTLYLKRYSRTGKYFLEERVFQGPEVDWTVIAGPLSDEEVQEAKSAGVSDW